MTVICEMDFFSIKKPGLRNLTQRLLRRLLPSTQNVSGGWDNKILVRQILISAIRSGTITLNWAGGGYSSRGRGRGRIFDTQGEEIVKEGGRKVQKAISFCVNFFSLSLLGKVDLSVLASRFEQKVSPYKNDEHFLPNIGETNCLCPPQTSERGGGLPPPSTSVVTPLVCHVRIRAEISPPYFT